MVFPRERKGQRMPELAWKCLFWKVLMFLVAKSSMRESIGIDIFNFL